jgi:hypothetical protein
MDLVVAQFGGPTVLLHDQTAQPGLRGCWCDPAGNTVGIGAVLRLNSGARFGPARALHAGAGYGSQDSAVPVLAAPEPRTDLHVSWPGRKHTVAKLPAQAAEVVLDSSGSLQVVR